ncbi:DUF488 domain-containing protein [Propionibacterium australiense]|uniref:DUF488 family protein n=1 Tax=Propionibacterium australiense TaxID=119981 RepID=A0A383S7C9_9ACTN|nr:DUF488 family protein [Propionibacterium australiense]RLP10956.1 DUF488 family protein [Propionibacterium australiense]SYZ33915.1 Protein of unknown function, DUF488 [Propionibacterium australiense]VEH90936.1 Uncharacterized conserved protein [Propionibacterium australiense]
MEFVVKRVYDRPDARDGYRVLVDRLWPRGVSKARAELDEWCKDVAPSSELRAWFGHRADRFEEFGQLYTTELESSDAPQALLGRAGGAERLTLVYAAKDPQVNHALVLADYLRRLI